MRGGLCYTLMHGRPSIVYRTSSHRSDHPIARYSSRIAIFCLSYLLPAFDAPVRGSRRNIVNVWYGKNRMVWLPDREKKIEGMFIRFDRIHERDGPTDTARRQAQAALMHSTARKKMRSCMCVPPIVPPSSHILYSAIKLQLHAKLNFLPQFVS